MNCSIKCAFIVYFKKIRKYSFFFFLLSSTMFSNFDNAENLTAILHTCNRLNKSPMAGLTC